jgi:hypothetical protein
MEKIKQEGEFKVSKPKRPKNLTKPNEVVKVDFTAEPVNNEVVKVVIPNTEQIKDAIQEQSANESLLRAEQSEVELQKVEQGNKNASEVTIEEITGEETNNVVVKDTEESVKERVVERNLPENIEKLVKFMEETGGSVEDYVRLNTDYSNVDEKTLLKEYYSRTRPHLDAEEIEFLIEDSFEYDEDIDEERDIRKKKLDYKEAIAKAKNHLQSVKDQYYDEIKLKSNVTKEQQEAYDFFNRYKKSESENKNRHERFKQETKKLFTEDFKGFEYNVGEKRFRYTVQNGEQVADNQSDINNFIGKFLDKEGNVSDPNNYHKALYTAMNSDKVAQHFYEQGKADAIKEIMTNSKNPGLAPPRQTSGEVFINGLRVKSVSGLDSSKLRIQTKKFNN